MKQIPLDINIKLKQCPICDTWMKGSSSQTIKGLFSKRVVNENKIVCPTCGYSENLVQEYSPQAVKMILVDEKREAKK